MTRDMSSSRLQLPPPGRNLVWTLEPFWCMATMATTWMDGVVDGGVDEQSEGKDENVAGASGRVISPCTLLTPGQTQSFADPEMAAGRLVRRVACCTHWARAVACFVSLPVEPLVDSCLQSLDTFLGNLPHL